MNDEDNETLLSSCITVSKYRKMEKEKNAVGIACFFRGRITERYIRPFKDNKNKNGFIMMASACLMIESLESFWNGWNKSPNGALAFCQFFSRNPRFDDIRDLVPEFYKHVRCGIMHQGETTGGWHIRRDKTKLFESSTKTINATVFLKKMESALEDYCDKLKSDSWDGPVWKKFRKKMNYVCENTAI